MYYKRLTWSEFTFNLKRKKLVIPSETSQLAKVLTTLDLTALGIGSTLGVGVYVLAGGVAKDLAGPSVVISFFIAAVASVFAGLCYAEFGARVPKAGSAYVYSYVTVGEFIAFIIGWNLILEYIIGSASGVKGLFVYIDDLANKAMSEWFEEKMPINVGVIADYPDFFSLGVTIIFSVALAFGAKESSIFNNVFTVVNLTVVVFIIVSGFWNVDADNWKIPEDEVKNICNNGTGSDEDFGTGGFAPYGVSGIVKGAAKCFYGFIGFDCIATAGEEAKTPQKSIPVAVVVSLLIVFLAYFGISAILTMVIPYCLQDDNAPFPHMYSEIDWEWARYVVSVGAICGLLASLLGAMFPLPRVIYALSTDGLIFAFMGKVHPKFNTPFAGTLIAGLLTGILACIFDLDALFEMMSIGTLMAYSMVAACVLILRFDESNVEKKDEDQEPITFKAMVRQMFNTKEKHVTQLTSTLVYNETAIFYLLSIGTAAILSQCETELSDAKPAPVTFLCIFATLQIILLFSINCQPRSAFKLTFGVPFVPWLPAVSMQVNIYLMTMLETNTWIQFGIWMGIGLLMYFAYGMWNSKWEELTKLANEKSENTPKALQASQDFVEDITDKY